MNSPFISLALLGTSFLLHAGEKDGNVDKLNAAFQQLDSFSASYQATTETGKTADFFHGADFESGWAYAIIEGRDKDGTTVMRNEQWATADGTFLMKNDGQVIVFDGFAEEIARIDTLRKLLGVSPDLGPMKIYPFCDLSPTEVSISIGTRTKGPMWLTELEDPIKSDETSVTFQTDDDGTVVINRTNGLIQSKTFKLPNGIREMHLVDWKKNPGSKAISGGLKVNLEDARRESISTMGIGRQMFFALLRGIIRETEKIEDIRKELPEFLKIREEGLVEYLRKEPLNGVGFVKRDVLYPAFENLIQKLSETAAKQGKDVNVFDELARDLKFQQKVSGILADILIRNTPAAKREEFLLDALGQKLTAKGKEQEKTLKAVEAFVERAYFRVRIERSLQEFLGN